MIFDILWVLAGLALIVLGAEILVDGASSIARKAKISEFVIGLTIVGFGTSCPELVVSLTGALEGNADISIGNVLGSNIFNVLLILGMTALIRPVAVTDINRKRDVPVALLVSFLFVFFGMTDHTVSRLEGIVLLLFFASYMYLCFSDRKTAAEEAQDSDIKERNLFVSILFVLGGLAALIFGGRFFVDNAVDVAHQLGVSDKVIAITLLAGGTSLPELATCIVAALKNKGQLALGNIIGSNIFNILLIIGISSSIVPLSYSGMSIVDSVALLVSAALVWMSTYTGRRDRIDRWEGALMIVAFAVYYVFLFRS